MSAGYDVRVSKSLGKIRTKLWRADELGAAELLRGSFAGYAYDTHTHDRACLALITHGAIRIKMRGGEFTARAGDLYAIDAEEPHAGWPVDEYGWRLRTLYVDLRRLAATVADEPDSVASPALAGPIIRDASLATLFHGVHACSEAAGPRLKREEHYGRFAARLLGRHGRAPSASGPIGREPQAVRRARDFLDHLAEIAGAAGLPPFRLFRAFERATGLTPHGYQRQARLHWAAALIRQGRPLSDVAAATGFADQAHLTRSFRKAMGVTPGAYQAAYLGG